MKTPEPQELKILKGLIKFAKKEGIRKFKWQDFEFDLSGYDVTKQVLNEHQERINVLTEMCQKMKLRLDVQAPPPPQAFGGPRIPYVKKQAE